MKCPVCELNYEEELPEDRQYHKRYHDPIANGLYARPLKRDHTIWDNDGYSITVVNFFSPIAQQQRTSKVARIAKKDTPYDFAAYSVGEELDEHNVHVFLLHHQNRIVGMNVMRMRKKVAYASWEQFKEKQITLVEEPIHLWTIDMMWVHRNHRGSNLGMTLVNQAARYLEVDIQAIGWLLPFTDAGRALVRKCCPDVFNIGD